MQQRQNDDINAVCLTIGSKSLALILMILSGELTRTHAETAGAVSTKEKVCSPIGGCKRRKIVRG